LSRFLRKNHFSWKWGQSWSPFFNWVVITVADSKKIKASNKKIDKIFEKMLHKGISVRRAEWDGKGKEPSGMSKNTVKTYSDLVKSLLRDANQRYGIADISKLNEDMVNQIVQDKVDDYHINENMHQASNLKGYAAAIKAFNLGVQETNIFKNDKKFIIADADEIRDSLKEQNVFRRSSASPVLRATPKECLEVLENIKSKGYDTETRKIAYLAGKISLETGGRISAILRLRASDINVTDNKITFVDDKGGKTRTVEVDKEAALFLSHLQAGKKGNQRLFTPKRTDGTFKSVKETRKEVSSIISDAGAHLNRTEVIKIRDRELDKNGNVQYKYVDVERNFTTHSFRKGFAMERTQEYLDKFTTKKELDDYVAARIAEDPKLKEKLNMVRDRINETREGKPRNLKIYEYAIFFCSVDLGHYRNDVITAFYTTFKELLAYYDEQSNKK
jgi:integrase